MKLKGCPLLVQSDTHPSMTVSGESHTRSYMLPCIGWKCAAFDWDDKRGFFCQRFGSKLVMDEEVGGSDA